MVVSYWITSDLIVIQNLKNVVDSRLCSLGHITDYGDNQRIPLIREKGCSFLLGSRHTYSSLRCTTVALHVLVWTVLEAIVSEELLTGHASTNVGYSVHTFISVRRCKIAPWNIINEVVVAVLLCFYGRYWGYVLLSESCTHYQTVFWHNPSVLSLDTVFLDYLKNIVLYTILELWNCLFIEYHTKVVSTHFLYERGAVYAA